MANSFATTSVVAKESLAILENMLTFAKGVNRSWESEYSSNMARGYAPGQTLNIKKPPRYTWRAGRVSAPQATVQQTVPLTLTQGGTDLNFTSVDRTLSIAQMEPMLMAAMATVANEIDRQGLDLAINACQHGIASPAGLGTYPTTAAQALQFFTDSGTRLDTMGAPRDKQRYAVLSPRLNGASVQALSGLFNSQSKLSDQYGSGLMVDSIGFNVSMDQNVQTHTNGTQAAGPTANAVNGAGQQGSSIAIDGAVVTGTITRGSKITFAGVNSVNPQSRQSTGIPAQFTVTADVPAGSAAIPISPPLVSSGQFQNVDVSPADNAALTILGAANSTWEGSVAYHRDAFTLATVPLYAPPSGKGVIGVAQESHKGINMRVIEAYDAVNDNFIMRFDVLFGWAATYPELAVAMAV
jgi:hypothetical protein